MDATLTIDINPREAVPEKGRVAWLETHGVPPAKASVTIAAPLALWARVTTINADGTVNRSDSTVEYALRDVALGIVRETGTAPETLPAGVLEILAAKREEEQRARTEKARRDEEADRERLESALATPLDRFVQRRDGSPCEEPSVDALLRAAIDRTYLRDEDDPRLAARRAELRALVQKEQAAFAAKSEACEAALRSLAAQEDDLARASAEGYPIARQVLDRLADWFIECTRKGTTQVVFVAVDTSAWSDPEDRAAPSPDAFRLLDAARAAAKASTLPSAIGAWSVSRIVRLDVCPHKGEHHNVTAVLATLRTPLGLREVTFSLEDLSCSHEGGYDE